MTFRFLLLFFAYYEKRDSFLPSGSWIALFWLPAETLSLNVEAIDMGANDRRAGSVVEQVAS